MPFGLGVLIVAFALTIAPSIARAGITTPSGLDDDVRFWEKVFTKYKKTQCVFHDKDDLTLTYGVANIPPGSVGYQSRVMRKYVETINIALKNLGYGQEPRSKLERVIFNSVGGERRDPYFFRPLVGNVRCQRGVPLDDSIQRSIPFVPMVKSILTKHGLPMDLAYLPHLESGYQVNVRSKAGARGLWQLMPATARLEGLKVTRTFDARTHPRLATVAAVGHLRELYEKTGSWPLAITAYNYGVNGMGRAIKKFGADYMTIRREHKTKIFGFAARNYYPSFLAVRNVASRLDGSSSPEESSVALEDERNERAPNGRARL